MKRNKIIFYTIATLTVISLSFYLGYSWCDYQQDLEALRHVTDLAYNGIVDYSTGQPR